MITFHWNYNITLVSSYVLVFSSKSKLNVYNTNKQNLHMFCLGIFTLSDMLGIAI